VIDVLLAEAAMLAERTTRALLWRIPEARDILTRPAYPGETDRAAEYDRIESALLWCGWFAQDQATLAQAREVWDEAVALRWRLVIGRGFRRATDRGQERALATYRAACLYDPSRGLRFWTFAKYRSGKSSQQHRFAMESPVRIPHDAAERGCQVYAVIQEAADSKIEYEPTWLAWALDQLSPRLKRVVMLRRDGESLAAIAVLLHVAPADVATLERRAIKALQSLR
jgi:hypothetical protein